MKTNRIVMAVVGGMLAASSASAFPYWNNATYAMRHKSTAQGSATFQIDLLTTAPSRPAAARKGLLAKVFTDDGSRPWGPARTCAVKSH
jgi:hypothetical protein